MQRSFRISNYKDGAKQRKCATYVIIIRRVFSSSSLWYPPLTLVKSSRTLKKIPSNDLLCNCEARWLKSWMVQRSGLVGSLFCERPTFLRGWNVTKVADEDFKCGMFRERVLQYLLKP